MKNFITVMFLLGMGTCLCAMFCCDHLPTQMVAFSELFLCAFGLVVTHKLLFTDKK